MEEKKSSAVYPKYINPGRYPKKAPQNAVENGISVFGAFDGPIANLNIHEARRPLGMALPRFFTNSRIKEWEAYEVSFDEGFICGAIYDFGEMVFNVLIFYDKENAKVSATQIYSYPRKCVANSLFGTTNQLETGDFKATIKNEFENDKVYIKADYKPKSKKKMPMATDLVFTRSAKPSVTIMPLGENRPLYTLKGFFKAEGTITMGDRVFTMNERSTGIIDDHKGFYPRHAHYDWITAMGVKNGSPLGINLCKNQALDPELYSENVLWLDGYLHLLPPVEFVHESDNLWHVFDPKHNAVDLRFNIVDHYRTSKGLGRTIGAVYDAPYGSVSGFALDNSGNRICLDGLLAMGEDIYYDLL